MCAVVDRPLCVVKGMSFDDWSRVVNQRDSCVFSDVDCLKRTKLCSKRKNFAKLWAESIQDPRLRQFAVAPSVFFLFTLSGEVSRSRRYCNAWPTRDEAGASS